MKKYLLALSTVLLMCIMMVGCETEATRVDYNIKQQAENFNITRRVVVMNTRLNEPVFELIAKMSITDKSDRLDVICEAEDGVYLKHIVNLNDETMWFVEDLSGAEVNKYRYEVNFIPEMIYPITVTMED